MTMAHTPAWDELQWSCKYRNSLAFKDKAYVGQLVFVYDGSTFKWIPYWVVGEEDGKYELTSAYGDDKLVGVSANKLGIAVSANGKTYHELH